MKFSKSLFLAFAGLGLFACSNEDVTDGNNSGIINGPADVAVKINLPEIAGSRAVSPDNTTDEDKKVEVAYIKVTLDADQVLKPTIEGTYSEVIKNGVCTFEGVENPHSIDVEINTMTGQDFKQKVAFETFENLNEISVKETRMTGFANQFTADASGNKYTVEVNMDHTMARLEFSGIHHAGHQSGTCRFKSGNLSGVLLNRVQMAYSPATLTTFSETEIDNFFKESGATTNPWDKVANGTFFPNASASFPIDGNTGDKATPCYAYNIYPAKGADKLPIFTLYFTDLAADNSKEVYVGTNGFAFVDQYKVAKADVDSKAEVKEALCGETPISVDANYYKVINFPAGYVYEVTDLEVPDDAIHTTPDGKGLTLEATIKVTDWKIVEGSLDWDLQGNN